MIMSQWVIDTGDGDFREAVLERSAQTPVIVDFWAPWCAPCRTLGPLLERLVDEQGGDLYLAKVNIDQNPALASAFRIQSIPFLAGFRDGVIVAEVVGALPEGELRAFLKRVLPTAAEKLAAAGERLRAEGHLKEAEATFHQALESDPRCEPANLGLARVHADRREDEVALQLLESISPGPFRQEADHLAASLRVRGSAEGDTATLEARIAMNPDDVEARFHLAQILAAASRFEEALDQYLEVIRRNKDYQDGAARKAMLDIFELIGSDAATIEHYRAELAKVLFS
jgi:putative thioredoxin